MTHPVDDRARSHHDAPGPALDVKMPDLTLTPEQVEAFRRVAHEVMRAVAALGDALRRMAEHVIDGRARQLGFHPGPAESREEWLERARLEVDLGRFYGMRGHVPPPTQGPGPAPGGDAMRLITEDEKYVDPDAEIQQLLADVRAELDR